MDITSISAEDKAYLEKFTGIKLLSLTMCKQLADIANLPQIASLERLELHDNNIAKLPENGLQGLTHLDLSNNALESVDELKGLEKLEVLKLAGNPLCKNPEYPKSVLDLLPQVKILDGQQCTGSNVDQKGVWVSDVTLKNNSKSIF